MKTWNDPWQGLSPRLGMADDARDTGKAAAQPALHRIHEVVDGADRQRRIDATMEIDDLAVGGLAHAHVVHLAETGDPGGERGKRFTDFADPRGGGVAAGEDDGRQWLDMRFHLHVGP